MLDQKFHGGAAVAAQGNRVLPAALRVVLFAALTAAGAQIEIPTVPVPYTLQTLFVLLAGALLGPRLGALSMLTYLGAGAIGLPVFASFGAGIAKLIGPTGGYLLAFPLAAYCVGRLSGESPSLARLAAAMAAALLVIFSMGTLQLRLTAVPDWQAAFSGGFLIFSWWDVIKLAAAASVARAIRGARRAS